MEGLTYSPASDYGRWAYDDFDNYQDTLTTAGAGPKWTVTATASRAAEPGGPLVFTTAALDNDPSGMVATVKKLVLHRNAPLLWRNRLIVNESGGPNAFNYFFGVGNKTTPADYLQNNGAGPLTDNTVWALGFMVVDAGSAAVIEAVAFAGTTRFREALSSTNRNNLNWPAASGISSAAYRDFEIRTMASKVGYVLATFMIDTVPVYQCELPTASAAMMGSALLVKAGAAVAQSFKTQFNHEAIGYAA